MKQSLVKKSMFLNLASMLLCMALLVGTTFAWFTDTAASGVNRIQAGALDVKLEMWNGTDWVDAEGQTLQFIDMDDNDLWEPGCTYTLPDLRVKNNGNLAIKFKVAITGITGNAKLNEAIDWSIGGLPLDTWYPLSVNSVSSELTISGHMKEDAGNEYQGLSIDEISITVFATQNTVESDSFGNQYDADAPYVLPAGVTTASFGSNVAYYGGNYYADLQAAIDAVGTSGTIYIKPEQNFQGILDGTATKTVFTIPSGKDITLELNSSTFEYQMQYPASGAGNMSIFKTNGGSLTVNGDGKMVVSNTADTKGGNYATSIFTIGNTQDSKLTINGGKYYANFTQGSDFMVLGIVDATAYSCKTDVTINNGYFYSDDTIVRNFYGRGAPNHIDMDVVINGGTFVAGDAYGYGYRGWIWNHGSAASADEDCSAEITVNGGKFINAVVMNYQMAAVKSILNIQVNDIDAGSTLFARHNKALVSNSTYWENCAITIDSSLSKSGDLDSKITITK